MIRFSPGKINLHLDIGPAGSDGYHPLVSIFLQIGLCDVLNFGPGQPGSLLTLEGNSDVAPEHDIIRRAYESFCSHSGTSPDVELTVHKRIPVGAGLGGGSGNAATTLVALNELSGGLLSRGSLGRIAAGLGSDVPFFLGGPAAKVTGKGEKVESLRPPRRWWTLLIHPGFSISTADAFSWLDEASDRSEVWDPPTDVGSRFLTAKPSEWNFFNSFTVVLEQRFPVYEHIKQLCAAAQFSNISGSGSVFFALYDSYRDAASDAARVSGALPEVRLWLKETLASSLNAVLE